MMHQRVSLRIRGKVQGVWYRNSAREEARRLKLLGFVQNCPDGSVEVVAEGKRPSLERLVAWCHQGPPAAQVNLVDSEWLPPTGEFEAFDIRR